MLLLVYGREGQTYSLVGCEFETWEPKRCHAAAGATLVVVSRLRGGGEWVIGYGFHYFFFLCQLIYISLVFLLTVYVVIIEIIYFNMSIGFTCLQSMRKLSIVVVVKRAILSFLITYVK